MFEAYWEPMANDFDVPVMKRTDPLILDQMQ